VTPSDILDLTTTGRFGCAPGSAAVLPRSGGPLFQLLRRAHLSDDSLQLLRLRIIVITLLAWLPLLVLSALQGQLLGGKATVPFLLDLDVQVRFLVAVPLLIASEVVVHQRLGPVVRMFLERRLIPDSGKTRFDAAIASAFRLRNSLLAEVLLIAEDPVRTIILGEVVSPAQKPG
jgi:hypothetical protein